MQFEGFPSSTANAFNCFLGHRDDRALYQKVSYQFRSQRVDKLRV